MEEDPFGFLLDHSKPSLSQEAELQNCPFARESETFLNSDTQSTWMSSQPVGIIMESPPDSHHNSIDDNYLTPPEHPLPSYASDSDKANLDLEFCDCVVINDHETEIVGREFDENEVSGLEIVSKKVELVETQEETENVDTEIIHLNSDDETEVVDDMEVESREFDKIDVVEGEIMSKEIIVFEEEGGLGNGNGYVEEIMLKKETIENDLDFAGKDYCGGDRDRIVGDDTGMNLFSKDELINGEVDCTKYGNSNKCCNDINGVENGHKEDVNMPSSESKVRGPGSFENEWGKSKEDIEKLKYVKRSEGADQRGEDGSVSEEGNVKLSMTGSVEKGNNSFLNLVLKASELLKSEVDTDYKVDFEETLRKKGIVFPRPRWWPAEGFN